MRMIYRLKFFWYVAAAGMLIESPVIGGEAPETDLPAQRDVGRTPIESDPPAGFPTAYEVLRSVIQSKPQMRLERARCELIDFKIDLPRTYPPIGRARLVQGRYKLTITAGGQTEVSYHEINHLITEKVDHGVNR